jgi:hypothetical protein
VNLPLEPSQKGSLVKTIVHNLIETELVFTKITAALVHIYAPFVSLEEQVGKVVACACDVLRVTCYVLRVTFYVLRFTFYVYVLRFTFYVLRFTFYVLRFTFYVLRFTLQFVF